MSGYVSFTSYDYAPIDAVPVIASFDSDGHIRPLYVRIEGNAFKVHSVWVKPSFTGIIEFNCKVIDNGCLKPLCISYHQTERIWTMPKRSS